jgi:FixJ family two-component response regulator
MIPLYQNMIPEIPHCVRLMTACGGSIPAIHRGYIYMGGALGNAMISIVDDDKSVREAAKALVRSLGYATATFASAEEFLESGRLCDTACLITDVQMPGMSGVDLQSHLMANGHRTPVIFVTAYPEESVRVRALDAGAFGFLGKPFNEASLVACLNRALEHYRSGSPE